MSVRPICVTCNVQMAIEKNNVAVQPKGDKRHFFGDQYTCELCHATIITGFGVSVLGNHATAIPFDWEIKE